MCACPCAHTYGGLMTQKGKNHFENGAAEIGHNKPLNAMQACMFNSLGKLHAMLESLLQA